MRDRAVGMREVLTDRSVAYSPSGATFRTFGKTVIKLASMLHDVEGGQKVSVIIWNITRQPLYN